jgi:AraC family transcriptional regulator of adaptative response / DNA-3-methyladenine glycosylase II
MEFLRGRTIKDVDWVNQDGYFRTVRLGKYTGWIAIKHSPEKRALLVEFTHSLTPALPALLGRLRSLFDLSARPDLIAARLRRDKILKKAVTKNPGLRVPGAFDGFELAVRAILGQQVTVKAATTLACRFAEAFGEKIETPFPELTRLSPTPERIAGASVDSVAKLGIVSARARGIIALAQAYAAGELRLDAGANPDVAIKRLTAIPGIGQWTAHYIAMRALRWPDAFPKEDIAVRNNLGGVTAKQAEEMSKAWSPWRSYAVLHIWISLAQPPKKASTKEPLSKE